jgi:peptidoglycan/LPS O-acetylase OafA/YrhL
VARIDDPPAAYRRALSGRMPTLDGVRGLAILMVLAHNFDLITQPSSRLGSVIDHLADVGWIGVQLFFVLSGFLITGILIDTRGAPNQLRAFFGRRVLRIFPVYYATLAVAFVILPLVSPAHAPEGQHQIWLWTYLVNWSEPFGLAVPAFPHFWSLAVEEQFYLVWPFVVRAVAPSRLLRLTAGVVASALAIRIGLRAAGLTPTAAYQWTIARMDALAAGAALATLLRLPEMPAAVERRWRAISACGALAAIAAVVVTRGLPRNALATQTVGFSLLALAFTYFVLAGVRADAAGGAGGALARVLRWAPLRSLGKYSYGMYVFHVPVHLLLSQQVASRWTSPPVGLATGIAYMIVATVVTYLAAVASYHLFEKHFLALKRAFTPGPAQPPSAPVAVAAPGAQ